MGIRQRGDSWEVNVAHKGLRRFGTAKTEPEAKDLLVTLKAELIALGRAVVAPTPTPIALNDTTWDLISAVKKTFEVRWNGTKSEQFYKDKTRALLAHFGDTTKLSEITTDRVDAYKLTLKGKAQATINHHLVTLSMLFKIAHQRGGAPMKPVLGIKRPAKGRMRWVSEEEERTMLGLMTQWGRHELVDWTIVMVDTGLRPSETRELVPSWVDLKTNMVHVWESKTPSGIRGVPMTKRVREVLERRCKGHSGGKLFPYTWQVYTDQWNQARSVMGLDDEDFVPYCLRHTFATRLVQRGVRIEVISRLLGHANITQTMIYAKLGAEQFIEAMKVLERA